VSLPKIRLERCEREREGLWRLDASQSRHLTRSLRAYEGAAVEGLLEDGGRRLSMRLERIGGEYFLREMSAESEPRDGLEITLVIGLLKAEQFDAVLRASSELGVKSVVPVICGRSVPRVEESGGLKKISRWERILDEGTAVSGSPFPPRIEPPRPFGEIAWDALPDARYAAMISPGARPLGGVSLRSGELAFAVGPEGDWTDSERDFLLSGGFLPVSLGRRIMRASTAAIAGCAWFRFCWDARCCGAPESQ
jgi:16S rRNA (uracil1498-N3)-methyltransferase